MTQDIHAGATPKIHIDNAISDEIPIKRGVRQWDPISRKLFTTKIQKSLQKQQPRDES